MAHKFLIPRGTKDILPPEVYSWQEIESIVRKIFRTYGYKEIRTPSFEQTGLFKRTLGENTDIVTKQLLELSSQKQDGFSLRPEGTASVVRAYIENNLDKKENLSKLYYLGSMYRGERPQKGRLRQFHQIGIEAIGPDSCSPYLDAEVISLSVNILKAFGLEDFTLLLNTLGSDEDKETFAQLLVKELKGDVKKLCDDCQQRFERNVLRILDCKNKSCKHIVDQLNLGHAYLSSESQKYYHDVKQALDSLKIGYVESPKLVRGLDYYNHTVFEITCASLGSQDALGAGGRYNRLVSQLGGPEADAIGFALGIERILLAMEKPPQPSAKVLDLFVIALDDIAFKRAFQLLDQLREQGVSADMNYRISSMKSQMRLADKTGARFVMIIGEEEIKKGIVTIKDMQEGKQSQEKIEHVEQIAMKLTER